ncbi:hypothetical protein DKP78_23965, partial [Enterococcus faecium]
VGGVHLAEETAHLGLAVLLQRLLGHGRRTDRTSGWAGRPGTSSTAANATASDSTGGQVDGAVRLLD